MIPQGETRRGRRNTIHLRAEEAEISPWQQAVKSTIVRFATSQGGDSDDDGQDLADLVNTLEEKDAEIDSLKDTMLHMERSISEERTKHEEELNIHVAAARVKEEEAKKLVAEYKANLRGAEEEYVKERKRDKDIIDGYELEIKSIKESVQKQFVAMRKQVLQSENDFIFALPVMCSSFSQFVCVLYCTT